MVAPSDRVVWKYSFGAQRTSTSTRWLSLNAFMVLKLFMQQDTFAFGTELVLTHACTLLQQMLFDLSDFNDLFAFPAASEHWALFPVVNV